MNISPNNDKIEKCLNELADEYKVLLYNALLSRSKPLDDLSVSELLRLDSEVKKPLLESYQKKQRKRRMLLAVGLTYMLLGFFTFVVFEIIRGDFRNDIESIILLMSVVIGFVGLFTSIISFALPTLNLSYGKYESKQKDEFLALLEYEVVVKWRELEGLVNDMSINADVKVPRSIISFLADNQFINEDECKLLKDFLRMRNIIAHSPDKRYSSDEVKEMIDRVDKLLEKIKKVI